MKRGDPPIFAKSNDIIVTTFQDRKRLSILSTVGNNTTSVKCLSILSTVGNNTTSVKRIRDRKQPEGYRTIEKPTICQNYNDQMGGVDHFDQQMKVSYSYTHKSVVPLSISLYQRSRFDKWTYLLQAKEGRFYDS